MTVYFGLCTAESFDVLISKRFINLCNQENSKTHVVYQNFVVNQPINKKVWKYLTTTIRSGSEEVIQAK